MNIYSTITFVLFLWDVNTAKQNVTVALVYQNYARSKVYDKIFKETLRNINSGQLISSLRNFPVRYKLTPVNCVLPKGKFFPSDVLHCLCEVVVKNQASVIVFVTATEEYDETTESAQFFLDMATQTGLPIIAWNADNSGFTFSKPMSKLRIIQMAPPIEHQIQAMLALLKRYQWLKFGVVCSKMPGSDNFFKTVQNEIQLLDDRAYKLELILHLEVDDTLGFDHIHRQLQILRDSDARIILVYSTVKRLRRVFEVAEKLGLLSSEYLYIGTQSVKGSLSSAVQPIQHGMLTINFHTISHAMFPPANDVLSLVIGFAPKLFATALAQLNSPKKKPTKSATSCFESMLPNKKGRFYQRLYEKLRSSYLKGNPYHAKDGQDSFFYLFNENGKLQNSYLTINNLRYQSGRTTPELSYFWDKVGEFTNGVLKITEIEWPGNKTKVVTLDEPPFLIVSELDTETGKCPSNQGGTVCDWGTENTTVLKCCTGFCVDLLNLLATDVGFTFTMYKVRDSKWGIKTASGWNGLIYDLTTNKADLCVTALKMNSDRQKDIDFSIPFLETGITIMVKIKGGALSPFAFLEPLEYSTWAMILFVGIHVSALAVFLFEWISPQSFNMKKYPPPGHRFSFCQSYWLVWATFFNASVSNNFPLSNISRIMSLVWAAFSLVFLAIFTANLAAFMILRVQFHQLSGLNDPMIVNAYDQKPPFRFGTVESGNTHEALRKNWKHLENYIQQNGFFSDNVSAGIEAIRNEEMDAIIYDSVPLEYQASRDLKCELTTTGKWEAMSGYAIGFQKNSPYSEKINEFLLQYQQKGDLERLQNFWLTGLCDHDVNTQSHSSEPLGIKNFTSAFLLLAVGMLIAVLGLGLEYFYCWRLRKWLQKIDKSGWLGLISISMGKTLTLTEAVQRITEWKTHRQSMSAAHASQRRESGKTPKQVQLRAPETKLESQ